MTNHDNECSSLHQLEGLSVYKVLLKKSDIKIPEKVPHLFLLRLLHLINKNCKLYIKIEFGYFSSNSRLILCQNRKDHETLYFKLHVNLMSLDFIYFTAF